MRVSKWGNSLAIRLPASVVEALRLKEGTRLRSMSRPAGRSASRATEAASTHSRVSGLFARNSLLTESLIVRRPMPGKCDAG
jgi:hypothetical protein